MDLTKEAIEKIENMTREKELLEVNGVTYSPIELKTVRPSIPMQDPIGLDSLKGLAGFINNDIDKSNFKENPFLLHVWSASRVDLISSVHPENKKRTIHAKAEVDSSLQTFKFGTFMPQEEFAIAFRSLFVPKEGDDFNYVLSYAAKMSGGTAIEGSDDGITQTVAVSRGVSGAIKGKETLKAIVRLSPYRTFREIDQPESEFLLRVRLSSEDIPTIALFEADGGIWRDTAKIRIAEYLQSLVTVPVII